MREIVLREAPRLGLAIRERSFTLDEALRADAMFITNARIGVVPVKRVREHEFAMSEIVYPPAPGHRGARCVSCCS